MLGGVVCAVRREPEFFMFTNFQAAKTSAQSLCVLQFTTAATTKIQMFCPFLWHGPVLLRELMVHAFDGVAPYIRYRIVGDGLVTPPGQMNST